MLPLHNSSKYHGDTIPLQQRVCESSPFGAFMTLVSAVWFSGDLGPSNG